MYYLLLFRGIHISFKEQVGAIFISAIIINFLVLLGIVKIFKSLRIKQSIRTFGPSSHLKKDGTPTMGGLSILISIPASILLWGKITFPILLILSIFLLFGSIGFLDDFLKVVLHSHKGLSGKIKYILLSVISIGILGICFRVYHKEFSVWLFPLYGILHGGIVLFIADYFVLVGSSNSVNLTDGLDGLVSVPVILVALVFLGICILLNFAPIYHLIRLSYSNSVLLICLSIIGSMLSFLWFNAYPAKIFMGDTGSLALGGILGIISIFLMQEVLLFIVGGVFVLEAISVILQVSSKKILHKKIFAMAPIHHHFELKGYLETRIVLHFWIASVLLSALGLYGVLLR